MRLSDLLSDRWFTVGLVSAAVAVFFMALSLTSLSTDGFWLYSFGILGSSALTGVAVTMMWVRDDVAKNRAKKRLIEERDEAFAVYLDTGELPPRLRVHQGFVEKRWREIQQTIQSDLSLPVRTLESTVRGNRSARRTKGPFVKAQN